MPPSEIDDIFASKGYNIAQPKPSLAFPDNKKKKRSKKIKVKVEQKNVPSVSSKRKLPETVFDPSAALPSTKKNIPPGNIRPSGSAPKAKKPKRDLEEEDRFKDSRGTGPRQKTEEGFSIYKEEELGINDQGGDTPLCPFDCQCCF